MNNLNDVKQFVKGCKDIMDREWVFKMIDKHSFELSQLLMRKKEVDFENIDNSNIPHKMEILHEKVRKGSMHFNNANI